MQEIIFLFKVSFPSTEKGFTNSFTGLKLVLKNEMYKRYLLDLLKALLELTGLEFEMWRGKKISRLNVLLIMEVNGKK